MKNVCAVRMLSSTTIRGGDFGGIYMAADIKPHQPVLFTEADREAMATHILGKMLGEQHWPTVGTPKLKNGSPVCIHCGSLYSEDADQS